MRCDSEHLPQFTFVRVTRIFSFTFTVNFTSYPPKATNSSLVFQQIFCIFIIVSCIFYGIITLLSCSKSCIVYIFYFIFELSGIISCIFPCYLFNIIIPPPFKLSSASFYGNGRLLCALKDFFILFWIFSLFLLHFSFNFHILLNMVSF